MDVIAGQQSLFSSPAELQAAVAAEFYRTPHRATDQLLNTAREMDIGDRVVDGLPGGEWIEAGSGDGALWSRIRDRRHDVTFELVEMRPDALAESEQLHGTERVRAFHLRNWLEIDDQVILAGFRNASVVVMNSPFSLTHRFIDAAFKYCPNAWIWSLQRISWSHPGRLWKPRVGEKLPPKRQETVDKRLWLDAHPPEYTLRARGARFSFTGDKRTDSSEYAWTGYSPTGRAIGHRAGYRLYCHE